MKIPIMLPVGLRRLALAIRSSFWFIPTLLTLLAAALAIFVLQIDGNEPNLAIKSLSDRFKVETSAAREALSTIAGSMITVASLVFSLTLVALTMVSQQFGPRIIVRFMDDRPTQFVLGSFIATFAYSLIMLIGLADSRRGGVVTGLSIVIAGMLTVLALGLMIHFIHHIATRIQANVIISELGNDLQHAVKRFVERQSRDNESAQEAELKKLVESYEKKRQIEILAGSTGYLTSLDEAAAAKFAREHKLVLELVHAPGGFVFQDQPVLRFYCDNDDREKNAMAAKKAEPLIGTTEQPTPDASIYYEIHALVDLALRALSPGINDPFTATACIDRLTDGFRLLMQRQSNRRVLRNKDDTILVIFNEERLEDYFSQTFDPIHHSGGSIPVVKERLYRSYSYLAEKKDLSLHGDLMKALKKREISVGKVR